jgi:hypothetical protein
MNEMMQMQIATCFLGDFLGRCLSFTKRAMQKRRRHASSHTVEGEMAQRY